MDLTAVAAILMALRAADGGGGASAVLAAEGVSLEDLDGFEDECERVFGRSPVKRENEALAVGFLAGRAAAPTPRRRMATPTSFLMDRDLLVCAAEGESILRLPWFHEELFVGRELPAITEIPSAIRSLAVESYREALAGVRNQYAFTSYGHTFTVDAWPVRGADGCIGRVLAVATPGPSETAGAAYAELRGPALPSLTARETEVLILASRGLGYSEIAAQLSVGLATVKTHLAHAYAKLGVGDKAAAVATAIRLGLIV
jgi:DNA-binding CsgD family transcriptional regulator